MPMKKGSERTSGPPVRAYWGTSSRENVNVRDEIGKKLFTLEATKWQYESTNPDVEKVEPESYYLDQALMERRGNKGSAA